MSKGSGLRLLALVAISVGNIPPYRPPGHPPPGDFEVARCPRCGNESTSKSGKKFYCQFCNKYFKP
jgi:hypothetical protein